MSGHAAIVWFRKDLRVHDNPALWEAIQQGPIVPVYILDPDEPVYGRASAWWLHHSLLSLNSALQQLGARLVLRTGSSLSVLSGIASETGARSLYFNRRCEPGPDAADQAIRQALSQERIEVRAFDSNLLFEPSAVLNQQQQVFKVFTPFWRKARSASAVPPLPQPGRIPMVPGDIATLAVEELQLLPKQAWHKKFASRWTPGEHAALSRWRAFAEDQLEGYSANRDFPASPHVSLLSPHLAWGEISPRLIWHELQEKLDMLSLTGALAAAGQDADSFMRQLAWREFAYHQLQAHPDMTYRPLRAEFLSFPWESDEAAFDHWKRGRTGYPLVDAGMRELWETGWMHNRVRMVAASFLVKHLLIPWTRGAEWFEETLLDADPANNAMGWQWVTGCGVDAAPYFRVFNPSSQAVKFDGQGEYIRRWVPEIAALPDSYIHSPWTAPAPVLAAAGIELGRTYPLPLVDHTAARERALLAYKQLGK